MGDLKMEISRANKFPTAAYIHFTNYFKQKNKFYRSVIA